MKDNEEFIKGIYNKYDEYVKDNKSKCNNKKPNKWINNTIKIIEVFYLDKTSTIIFYGFII